MPSVLTGRALKILSCCELEILFIWEAIFVRNDYQMFAVKIVPGIETEV